MPRHSRRKSMTAGKIGKQAALPAMLRWALHRLRVKALDGPIYLSVSFYILHRNMAR